MNFNKPHKKQIEINIIPIINIVFLLLIFFITTGTLKNNDVIPINAPVSESGEEIATDPIEILVSEDELIINLELVEKEDLKSILHDLLITDAETEIMLKADAQLDAKKFIEVLKLVREAGGKNLFLVTEGAF